MLYMLSKKKVVIFIVWYKGAQSVYYYLAENQIVT